MFLRNGSGALGLCDVACGRLIGYVEAHINSWDCLGAIGVCRSAGARVSDYLSDGGLLNGGPIVAGSPQVYDELVAVLGSAATD
jgi:myo-inositol-1(or 4)-monophosphatase